MSPPFCPGFIILFEGHLMIGMDSFCQIFNELIVNLQVDLAQAEDILAHCLQALLDEIYEIVVVLILAKVG
jgi:hypothetical protein